MNKSKKSTRNQTVQRRNSHGETIVEVLFATVILSTVIAGAYTLTNRATRIGQSSIERTEAVNRVETTAEALRGVAFERGEPWTEISSNYLSSTVPSYDDETSCAPTSGSQPFHLDINDLDNLSDAAIISSGTLQQELDESGNLRNSLFTQWIEAYERPNSSYVDFHIRSCWNSISGNEINRSGAVLRLYTGR